MNKKEELSDYIERMNRFNDFENISYRNNDEKKKMAQFVALFQFGYKILPLEKIQLIQNESLENIIEMQNVFSQIAHKLNTDATV
jgi:hypothetical protein